MIKEIKFREACVGSLKESVDAENKGANRLELCAELHLGGTTPSYEMVKEVLQSVNIPVKLMIRCRGGNFVYNSTEIEIMKLQLNELKALNPFGFVFGFLTENGSMNMQLTQEFCNLSAGFDITIHKAFDLVLNPLDCFSNLKKLNIPLSVLTSGQAETAEQGQTLLKKLVESDEGKIKVIVAGKVTYQNIEKLHTFIGASEYHGKQIV